MDGDRLPQGHPIEREVGIAYYVSRDPGIGGRIRDRNANFRVREIEAFDVEPADADPDAYPHLVIRATLEGWDTNDFASRLSDAMGISRERVSWAGTKDKRAITTQLFSVRKGDPDELPEMRGAEIEVVGRAGRALEFGDLAGNEFEIRVDGADRPENVDPITDQLREFGGGSVGVPNYFGQQRFGSRRPVTHEVGIAVVRGDWRGAVMAYLGDPREAEPEDTREARSYVEHEVRHASDGEIGTDVWQSTLERFPRKLGYERSMLHRLVENGASGEEDFREALEAVPSNLQRLFVNAAQSYLFNRVLSERLERGLPFDRAVAGDVVCFSDRVATATEDALERIARLDPDRTQRVTESRVETINRHLARNRAFVTAPLVGTESELSQGEPGEIERAVLEDEGISPSDFDLPGEFDSTGTRRAILLTTDLSVDRDPLTFSFALPSGSYATVLLREYLKGDPRELS